jgi:lipopolysaccharide/colanic/teichoic acid biosynthesis glycosyltransferase
MNAFARPFDVLCGAAGLLLLSPVFALLALLILLRDGRPIFFSQIRTGRYGIPFRIWKFRTMRNEEPGLVVTAAGDHRVTANGAWLRRLKLDELPQLYNVLRGDMALLGPRPEVPQYVNPRSPVWQAVLQVRPGITDLATLLYRDEENLLACSDDADRFYREAVLPAKLRLNLAYIRTRCLRLDVRLIWLTIRCSLSPRRFDPSRIRRVFSTAFEYGG